MQKTYFTKIYDFERVNTMRIKNISFIMMLMAVFVTGSVYADIVVSNLSENTVRRLSPDGALVWQDTAGARSTNQMTFGPDENGNP